jgi:hypothetical protein
MSQSFAVKSTHRFVNSQLTQEPDIESLFLDKSLEKKGGTSNTDNNRKEGSAKGMVIRTTNTSVEDYY